MISNPFDEFEIDNMSDSNYDKIDLHKHIVDDIILTSSSNKKMFRETDLIDVWFDSGSMPYAQWHYPFENKKFIDDKKFFPADYIAEGVDQTRGWFYTLHVISTLIFNSNSYKNVISNGLVLDKNGQKMSKRLGNAVDPFETLDKYGPDATRWYMISNSNPWDNLKFDVSGIEEVRRKFFGTLHNIYSFFSLYANIDGFVPNKKIINPKKRNELENIIQHSFVIGFDYYYYSKNKWLHAWGNIMPWHYDAGGEFSYHKYNEGQWLDYSAGMVFGHWFNKNLGVFVEGTYNKYWNREWHGFSAGINYRVF